MDRLLELDARMDDDPIAAREELRRYLDAARFGWRSTRQGTT